MVPTIKLLFGAIIIFVLLLFAVTAGCSSDKAQTKQQSKLKILKKDASGKNLKYATPESFLYDKASGFYFISNINGSPAEKDGNGYIIKLDSAMNLVDNYFIDGKNDDYILNAPKGMAVINGALYVTDIDMVRYFDIENGEHLGEMDFRSFEPKFLNDLAFDSSGNLYVSDMLDSTIYKVEEAGEISVFITMEDGPNGLLFHADSNLYNVTWHKGRLLRISLEGQIEEIDLAAPMGHLDGIDADSTGVLYFSDHKNGIVYTYDLEKGLLRKIVDSLNTPADISLDEKHRQILIPQFNSSAALYELE